MIKVDAKANQAENGESPRSSRVDRQPRLPRIADGLMTLPHPDGAFHWTSEGWGNALRGRRLAEVTQHLFTSRQLALPEDHAWRAALASVGSTPDRLMRVKQVHGNVVRVLERGRVGANAAMQRPDGDAIVSNEPGLVLAVLVADCVPILLCDPVGGAAAAIHAGWRGTCARVGQAAIDAMQKQFACDASRLVAAIGPSVGPDDYEVGDSLITSFRAAAHRQSDVDRWFIRRDGRLFLDLWTANVDQLTQAGIPRVNISVCGLSTVSHPDIFDSYRVAGERAGRMAAIIVVP